MDAVAPTLNREPERLRHLPIGNPQHRSEMLAANATASAGEVLVRPVRDTLKQLERCASAAESL